jgi:hypothetical protein
MDIIKIMKSGDGDVFAKMKVLLLTPDLQLKGTCQRLSDVLKLMNRLGGVEENFGLKDMLLPTNKESAKHKEGNILSSLLLWARKTGSELETLSASLTPDLSPRL